MEVTIIGSNHHREIILINNCKESFFLGKTFIVPLLFTGVFHHRCSIEQLSRANSQISLENTCDDVLVVTLQTRPKKRHYCRCFPVSFTYFYRTPLSECFCFEVSILDPSVLLKYNALAFNSALAFNNTSKLVELTKGQFLFLHNIL